MNNLPSVLLIDDETDFQKAFAESLRTETQKGLFQLELVSFGRQGLEIIKNNSKQGRKTFALIDIILPDILGDQLVAEIAQNHTNTQAILISAHKSDRELEQIKNRYNWIINSLTKPLDKNQLKNAIKVFLGHDNLSGFDYTALDQTTADFVFQETERIKTLMRQTVEGIIETGERLHKVKQRLKHGEFMAWVENEIKCHYSTALHFMRVWQTFGEKKAEVSDVGLNVSVLYLLSAPSTPEELRTEILERAKAGNSVSFAEVKRLKKEYTERKNQDNQTKSIQGSSSDSVSTINISADEVEAGSALDSTSNQLETTQFNSTAKQEIISIIPQAKSETKFWNLGRHLLYYGSAQASEFRDRLPETVALNIGFPMSPSWEKKSLFPISAKSTLVFYSAFQDLDLVSLRNIVQKSIEICTESTEKIIFSYLPYPEMLVLADKLKCKCFVAEPDWQKCQNIVTFWESVHS